MKTIHLLLLACAGVLLSSTQLYAQSPQDCYGAIPVCQNSYTQSTSYTGVGSSNELNPSNQGCLTTGENNSVWYIINTTTAGLLTFDIVPNAATDDYDFAVWDLTDKSCDDMINGQPPIRCNYASLANSAAGGNTGLSTSSSAPSLGASGPSYSSAINATVGQTFLILINNASSSSNGYNLNFGGTASVTDNLPPGIKGDTIEATCNAPSYITLLLTENVQCSTLTGSGSDFNLSPANATVSSAVSQSCTNGSNFTNLIRVDFSNPLPPGNYTLNVVNGSDGNTLIDNCNNAMPQNTAVNFVVQPPVQVNVMAQSGCANATNGIITASGQFGTPPYQFRLNNGGFTTNNVFSGLATGTYTVRIRDANGCIDDTTLTVAPANPIMVTNLLVSNPLCFGQNTGSVAVTASGGNPPLQYTINSLPYQNNNTLTGLGPGNYFVRVRDANGCTVDTLIFISAPGQLSFNSISNTSATCGQNNGSINAIGFGGTPPLMFSLNNGPNQSSGSYSNLASGSYTLRLIDANGCFVDTVIQIQQQNGATISSLSLVQPTCTSNSGSITVNTNGGVGPIQYSLNGGAAISSNTFSSLGSGTYTVVAIDANGCTDTSIANLISPANLFFTSSTIVQPTCTSLGSISVQGSGGSPPLSYALNTGPYSSNSTSNNLGAGTYTIHLRDANNCIHDTIITLTPSQVPSFTSIPLSQPSCSFPSAGSITANVTGGTPSYSFVLNGGTPQTTNSFTNLGAGAYTITVTDANGCTITTSVSLLSTNTVSFNQFTTSNVGCFGTPLGSITSSVSGGNTPYQYTLNGGTPQGNGNFTGLNGGSYTVVATDASGCSTSSVVTVLSSGTVLLNSVSSTNSACFNPPSGSITISGTVSNGPISYSVAPGLSNTTGNFTGLNGGTYTATVSDAAGCSATTNVTITAPPPMYYVNPVIIYPPCWGGVGSISLQGAGGTPPYTYSISNGPFGSVSSWNNLLAGTYPIRFQDANGCFHDTTIILIEPPNLIFNGIVSSNSSCNTQLSTGSITVTGSGGTPPYTYAINGGPFSTNNSFNNLGAGSYLISILDSSNCQNDTTIVILANGNYTINSITRTPPSCNGGNDGTISFTVSGGVAPYLYSLNLSTYQANNNFTGLSAGSYNLRSIDNSGCFDDTTIVLSEPNPVNFSSLVLTNPSCNNGTNGTVLAVGSGGVGSYTYAANNGPFSSSNTLSALGAGTHTISVRDANNCQFDTTITLSNPTSVVISSLTIINPGCLGGGGTISYTGTGGSGPYTFSIDGINYVTPGLFNNLSNGNYTIYVQDANGCIDDTTVVLNGTAAVLISSFSYSPYICPGQTNGTINVTASSSNPPILYSILGSPAQATGSFTGLSAGTYTIRSEDNQGCYVDSTVTIQQAPNIVIDSAIGTSVNCSYSTNGSISIYARGGVQPLSYQLGGSGYGTNSVYNNLGGGNYFVYVQDSAGCIVSSNTTIAAPPPITTTSILIQQPFCSSATDGSISINVQGGVPPYLYAINTSLFTTNNVFSNLVQGTYTIQIRDANNCQFDTTINLVANNYMQFASTAVQNVSCAGGSDGLISLLTTGGFAPYSYTINNIGNGSSGSFANLGIGQYTIVVTDTLGCQHDTIITITEPPNALSIGQNFMTPNRCKGDSAGAIGVMASGGTAPYQYALGGTNFQSNGNFSSLAAGFYQIYAEDANGCRTDSIFQVTEPDTSVQLQLLGVTSTSCIGVDDGSISVRAQYGYQPYLFILNGSQQGTDTFYNNLAAGNYIVEVLDSIGCRSTGKYVVPLTPISPIILIDSLRMPFCRGDVDGYMKWSTLSPYTPFTYTFDGTNIGGVDSANNLGIGVHTIEVMDSRGCRADTSFTFIEGSPIDLEIVTTPAACEGEGNDGAAKAIVTGGTSPFTFVWSSNIGISTDSIYPARYGDYFAIVFDDLNCSDTVQYKIPYQPCCNVTLPNAFTPNADGLNDVFRVIGYGQIELLSFEIFNRWGNKVFYTNILEDSWNGQYKNLEAPIGTYYYVIKYKCHFTGNVEQKQGDVTLIR